MTKLSEAKVSSLVSQRFGAAHYLSQSVKSNLDKIYQVDNIVVLINSNSMTPSHEYLATLKLAIDNLNRTTRYSSKMEIIGDKRVLIIDHDSEGCKLYRFFLLNKEGDFRVNGFVQYTPGDEAKARGVLEDLIKGLKFKVQ